VYFFCLREYVSVSFSLMPFLASKKVNAEAWSILSEGIHLSIRLAEVILYNDNILPLKIRGLIKYLEVVANLKVGDALGSYDSVHSFLEMCLAKLPALELVVTNASDSEACTNFKWHTIDEAASESLAGDYSFWTLLPQQCSTYI
jgi:hypothetical protein